MSEPILQMNNIRKSFSGVNVLTGVDLEVQRGEVHAVIGENGCGKTTLMNILSGVYPFGTYSGEIVFEGKPCRFKRLRDSEKKGIAIIHQELSLIPHMSIAENIYFGHERKNSLGIIDWDMTYSDALEVMNKAGLKEDPRCPVNEMSAGKRQLTEIAKALSKNAKLLILDEPTSSLDEEESMRLLDLLKSFKNEGITSIIISHKLNEIEYVADRITVLRDGETVETMDNSGHSIDEDRIIRSMVGRALTNRYPKRTHHKSGSLAVELSHYTVSSSSGRGSTFVKDVSLKAAEGEIVGIAGLHGAGRTRLLMSLFGGLDGCTVSGDMKLFGRECRFKSPKEAIKHGLVYLTEDRSTNGLLLGSPITDNTTLAAVSKITEHFIIDREREQDIAESFVKSMGIRTESVMQVARSLSGGNQQKVLLSRWLFTEPEVILLDEPTRGIDVAAKYDIYTLINRLVESGKTIIMASSSMEELIGMCDRIYVMNDGAFVAEFEASDVTQEKIMKAIIKSQNKGQQ